MMTPEELIEAYKEKHKGSQFSRGTALLKHIPEISRLCALLGCHNILDYGCGKAWFWNLEHWKAMFADKVRHVELYDPAIPEYDDMPSGRFDMVVCTDVIEHIHPEQTDDFLKTIFLFARRCVFLNISTKPAKKTFEDGTNVHINLRTRDQWDKKIYEIRDWYGDKYKAFPALVIRYDEEIGT